MNWFCLAHGNVKLSFTRVTVKEQSPRLYCEVFNVADFRARRFDMGGQQSSSYLLFITTSSENLPINLLVKLFNTFSCR